MRATFKKTRKQVYGAPNLSITVAACHAQIKNGDQCGVAHPTRNSVA